MRVKIFITVLFALAVLPMAARAVDQTTIDRMTFLLQQPEGNPWGQGVFDDLTLYDGLLTIYAGAVNSGDTILLEKSIWAMGETHLAVFAPTLIGSLPDEPVASCMALGKIPSENGVDALIGMLDNDKAQIRDAAVWGLGNIPYDTTLSKAKDRALAALGTRLQKESESWVRDDINGAIALVTTGVSSNPAFQKPADK
jgi:hypothetical protein